MTVVDVPDDTVVVAVATVVEFQRWQPVLETFFHLPTMIERWEGLKTSVAAVEFVVAYHHHYCCYCYYCTFVQFSHSIPGQLLTAQGFCAKSCCWMHMTMDAHMWFTIDWNVSQ